MFFALTPEQTLAKNALRELLTEHCSATQLRQVFDADAPTRVPGLWSKLHALGVVGVLAPEAVGGLGLTAIELTALLEETGRAAVPDLVVETAAVAVPLLAAVADHRAAAALARVLSGELTVALSLDPARTHEREATGSRGAGEVISQRLVAGAALAGAILCERSGELHLVTAEDAQLTPLDTIDRARPLYHLDFEPSANTLLASGAAAQPLLAAAHDHAALGTAAQLVGLGTRMLEMTIEHVKTRKQFGQAIGVFQAVKHQLVDARLGLEFAAPLVYRAAHSLAHADPQRSLHVSMAKAFASDAALTAARKALQLHGAIGYSYEYALHQYMKRAWALAAAHGDARVHRQRISDAMLTAR
jgi:alkylation response protein AidB-like acyl-CoA dehydrogenase